MKVIEYAGLKIKIDDEGYLMDYNDWNEKAACALAEREGIEELTEDRLEILRFIRKYYKDFGSYPVFGSVCLNVNQPKQCATQKFIDPVKAWKIAGIPNPGKEVVAYLNEMPTF